MGRCRERVPRAEVLGRPCGAALGPGASGVRVLEEDAGGGTAWCWDRVLAAAAACWFLVSATDYRMGEQTQMGLQSRVKWAPIHSLLACSLETLEYIQYRCFFAQKKTYSTYVYVLYAINVYVNKYSRIIS